MSVVEFAPIFLCDGERDTTVPIASARRVAEALPHCSATYYPNDGHLSVIITGTKSSRPWRADLIAAMRSTLTWDVDSNPTIVIDHVSRMHDDITPEWPQPYISIQPRDLAPAMPAATWVHHGSVVA